MRIRREGNPSRSLIHPMDIRIPVQEPPKRELLNPSLPPEKSSESLSDVTEPGVRIFWGASTVKSLKEIHFSFDSWWLSSHPRILSSFSLVCVLFIYNTGLGWIHGSLRECLESNPSPFQSVFAQSISHTWGTQRERERESLQTFHWITTRISEFVHSIQTSIHCSICCQNARRCSLFGDSLKWKREIKNSSVRGFQRDLHPAIGLLIWRNRMLHDDVYRVDPVVGVNKVYNTWDVRRIEF